MVIAKNAFSRKQEEMIAKWPYYKETIADNRLFYAESSLIRTGKSGHKDGIDLSGLDITVSPKNVNDRHYWTPDERLHEYMASAALKSLGKLKDDSGNPNFDYFPVRYDDRFRTKEVNDTVRLSEFTTNRLSIERATYLDQLGTNMACDEPLGKFGNKSLREIDTDEAGRLLPFSECRQVNSIGVAALAVDRYHVPMMRLRDREKTATMSGWHCFSSGVLTWQDVLGRSTDASNLKAADIVAGFARGLKREINKETGIAARQIPYQIAPYCLARELSRGGKPQLFYVIRFPEDDARDLIKTISQFDHTEHEYADSDRRDGKYQIVRIGRTVSNDGSIAICQSLKLDEISSKKVDEFAEHMMNSEPAMTREFHASLHFIVNSYNKLVFENA